MDDYEELLSPIVTGRQTFVLGSRHGGGGWAIRKFNDQPMHALVLNLAHWTFTLMINASLGIWLNPFTMYKVFHRRCLDGLTFECDRFDFDWELLIKLVRKGAIRPIEIPSATRPRSFKEGKKISMVRDPVTWIRALVKYRFARL